MGKLLDKYTADYNAAIKPGLVKGHTYVVKPEIWIYFKWEEDNGLSPQDPVKLRNALRDAVLREPEFGQVLVAGMGEIFSGMQKEGSNA